MRRHKGYAAGAQSDVVAAGGSVHWHEAENWVVRGGGALKSSRRPRILVVAGSLCTTER
jgi:hypothetical protein